jgi:hypothetical protein
MATATHTVFYIQGDIQQGWRRLQQCTDSHAAMQALERFQAQGRYENLRLLKIDQNDWEEPVGHTVLREYHSGQRLSDDDTVEQTRALRSSERRKRLHRALPRHGALALTFIASVGLGVLFATY